MSPPSSLLRAELEAGSGAVPSQTAAVEEKKKNQETLCGLMK